MNNDSDFCGVVRGESFKQIEDIIDARKLLGQYNVYKNQNTLNIRCVYSNFNSRFLESTKAAKCNENTLVLNEMEVFESETKGLKRTDSEITIVKVKCNGDVFNKTLNKWDMNDIAIPGNGTHLGESPSLVNLATLVAQNVQCEGDDEYLVPLSSWDPFIKNDDPQPDIKCCSDSKINGKNLVYISCTEPNIYSRVYDSSSNSQLEIEPDEIGAIKSRSPSWAGKFSKFWRKHWCKLKSINSSAPMTSTENQQKQDPNSFDIDKHKQT